MVGVVPSMTPSHVEGAVCAPLATAGAQGATSPRFSKRWGEFNDALHQMPPSGLLGRLKPSSMETFFLNIDDQQRLVELSLKALVFSCQLINATGLGDSLIGLGASLLR